MADLTQDLLKGIIAHLKADVNITALVGNRIYSHIPQNAEYPNIQIQIDSEAFDTHQNTDQNHDILCQIFSEKKSPSEVLTIREAIYNSLNRQFLSLDNGETSDFATTLQEYFKEDDGKTFQGLIRFTCATESN